MVSNLNFKFDDDEDITKIVNNFWKSQVSSVTCSLSSAPKFTFQDIVEASYSLCSHYTETLYRKYLINTVDALTMHECKILLQIIEQGTELKFNTWNNCIMNVIWQFIANNNPFAVDALKDSYLMNRRIKSHENWDYAVSFWLAWKKQEPENHLVPTEVIDDLRFLLKERLDGED